MHKFFGFLKSSVQFLQVIMLLFILLYLLYWIECLSNQNFDWLNFAKPLFMFFIYLGSLVSDKSINLFAAVLEYKFAIALVILLAIYLMISQLNKVVDFVEMITDEGNRFFKKVEEDAMNKSFEIQHKTEQKKINRYLIYVKTDVKKKFSHVELNINHDEQNQIMNKFLIEKTGISPTKYEDGFLYEFNNFNNIDDILKIYFKLLHSTAPLDYTICVQIVEHDIQEALDKINMIKNLRFVNKISMTSDTAYRYKFNEFHHYGISQLGIYQKGEKTFEAMEFQELSC